MSDIQFKCGICEADFRPGVLDKEGKCPSCQKEYPSVRNKAEAMAINLGRKLDEKAVRQIVREELNEFKAVLKAEHTKETKEANLEKARAARGKDDGGGK